VREEDGVTVGTRDCKARTLKFCSVTVYGMLARWFWSTGPSPASSA
jgi:hypothetical protein